MRHLLMAAGVIICLCGLNGWAWAQDTNNNTGQTTEVEATSAQGAASGEETLTVTVLSISGTAEAREGPDKLWQAIKVGDTYKEGSEIRTGFGGEVKLVFADNSQITIQRASYFRVDKFRRSGQTVVTRSHLSYGKIQAGVEKGPAFSDYKITTSLGTLGVNGTREIGLEVDPGSGTADIDLSDEGNIGWNTGSGSDTNVDPGGSTDENGSGQDETGGQNNNVNLLDQFGSTDTELGLGDNYGNQGDNSQNGAPNNANVTTSEGIPFVVEGGGGTSSHFIQPSFDRQAFRQLGTDPNTTVKPRAVYDP